MTKGPQAFFDYFLDKNGSMIDKGLENAMNAFRNFDGVSPNTFYEMKRKDLLKDHIIIHLRFMKPEIDLIDVKYTFLDKIANFGGNFGIFAEMTGFSFLGILNFCIILFKLFLSNLLYKCK